MLKGNFISQHLRSSHISLHLADARWKKKVESRLKKQLHIPTPISSIEPSLIISKINISNAMDLVYVSEFSLSTSYIAIVEYHDAGKKYTQNWVIEDLRNKHERLLIDLLVHEKAMFVFPFQCCCYWLPISWGAAQSIFTVRCSLWSVYINFSDLCVRAPNDPFEFTCSYVPRPAKVHNVFQL